MDSNFFVFSPATFSPVVFNKDEMVAVGTFGKSVGLNGFVRLFLLSDFEEILKSGARFYVEWGVENFRVDAGDVAYNQNKQKARFRTQKDSKCVESTQHSPQKYLPITISAYNPHNNTLQLKEFAIRNLSDMLRNKTFFSTISETRHSCKLQKDEFFYFDIIGLKIIEDGEILGRVKDIENIGNTYYFVLERGFLIPYNDRYVLDISLERGEIFTRDAKYLKA